MAKPTRSEPSTLRLRWFGKEVALQTHVKDKYGRTLADVLMTDGTNVNHELVKQGWCWWDRKYAPLDTELEHLEQSAREAKRGLWADAAPIPPWVYRKARRGQSLDLSDMLLPPRPLGTEPAYVSLFDAANRPHAFVIVHIPHIAHFCLNTISSTNAYGLLGICVGVQPDFLTIKPLDHIVIALNT